jgi:hypothetical protein
LTHFFILFYNNFNRITHVAFSYLFFFLLFNCFFSTTRTVKLISKSFSFE